MHVSYVEANSIQTQVLSLGHKIEDRFDDDVKEIVLILPGCPGIPKYYTTYLTTVYNYLDKKIPVFVVSHAGIADPDDIDLKIPPLKGNKHLFDKNGNIQHKVDFIKRYIPENIKIHLIGHSFGAWCAVQLLKIPEINKRIHYSYALFPSIDHVGQSPNGVITSRIKFLFPLAKLISQIFYHFPQSIRIWFVSIYCFVMSIPKNMIEPFLMNCKPSVVSKGLFLFSELMFIDELDADVIKANVNKIKIYYGTEKNDGWSNETNYKHLMEKVPEANAEVDNKDLLHCFQFRTSLEMGQITANWIINNRA